MSFSGGGPGMSGWAMRRSLTGDPSVTQARVSRETALRILRFAAPYRGLIWGYVLLLSLDALLVVTPPLLFRRIVDDGITAGNARVVTVNAVLVLVVAVVSAILNIAGRQLSARLGEGLIYDLRTQVFDHVQRQPIAFFTRTQTGALVSRLNSDVIGAQQAFTSTLAQVVANTISVVVILGTMIALSWQITALSLLLLPLFLLPARRMGRLLSEQTREQMTLNAAMSGQMTERFNVAGALLVKLFGRPQDELDLFADKAGRVRDIGVTIAMSNRYFATALTMVGATATAIAYGVGGNLVVSGSLSLGTLLALTALLGQMYGPLTILSSVRVTIMTALVSFERVFEVLDLPPLVAERPTAAEIPDGPVTVRFDEVHFAYPQPDEVSLASLEAVARTDVRLRSEPVLQGVSFTVEPGRMVALVGPSGAGKTTITSLVSRLYDVTSGAVLVGGVDVREATFASLRRTVGVVSQDAHMFHDTIAANLRYARPVATDEELLEACRASRIADLIAELPEGLETVVGDRGHRLSGGEKQRLAIARLLLKAPAVVVLDEATAHLDSENEAAVQGALAQALVGRTSIVIAHRLSTIRAADEILVITGGRVAERGSHDSLLAADGEYAELYRTQFRQVEHDAASEPPD
ncbi:MAG: ABC transporter ATP-binding protein [Candidatus Nanopelagicales bacterium]